MSDFDNNRRGMNRKPLINITVISIVFAFFGLLVLVVILGWNFFSGSPELKKNDIITYVIFSLIGFVVSSLSSALTSFLSQKTEENRESNMVAKIIDVFDKKVGEIKSDVNVALKKSDLVNGDREDILRLLMTQSLLNGEITRIKILAHDSSTFSKFFMEYFKDAFLKSKEFNCKELDILIHDQRIGPDHDIIKKWHNFYKDKTIDTLRIRRAERRRRSFFGMVIEFDGHHPIGLIGFYEPQDEDGENKVNVLNNPYGVFSEEGASILNVLTKYFSYYWDNAFELKEETKKIME